MEVYKVSMMDASGSIGRRERMVLRSLLILAALAPTSALASGDFTYTQWVQSSQEWRRGFAFAMAEHLMVVVIPTEAPTYPTTYGYKICLTGVSDMKIAQVIDTYLTLHPESHNLPMVGVAMKAMHDRCAPLLPEAGQ